MSRNHYPDGHNVGLGMVQDSPEEREISRLTSALAAANSRIADLEKQVDRLEDRLVELGEI
jgi:predicted  nucleic acid-binding Zn-ribbon protein